MLNGAKMTNSSPPEPQSSRRRSLGFKEAVGVVVAFSAIGTILWGSLPRDGTILADPILPLAGSVADPTEEIPQAVASPTPTPEVGEPGLSLFRRPLSTQPSPIAPAEAVSFADLGPRFWAYPFIIALAQQQIVSGFEDGTFRPQNPVTRAEFAAMIQKAFTETSGNEAVVYKDVPDNFWGRSAIQQATQTQFLRGYPGQIFQPTQQIPRVQALVSLASGLGLQAPENAAQILEANFGDADQIPPWAVGPVAAAAEAGLVVNHPDPKQLNPNEPTTRASAAALIYQALAQSERAEPIPSEYIVRPQAR
jgi:hypothetical protein